TVPIAIGYLAKDGDFRPALVLVAALALIGLCSYIFLVGKVEQIQLPNLAVDSDSPSSDPSVKNQSEAAGGAQ
ncbi:MAG: MFS transporter, partial [Paraglaciecola polaris]